MKKHDMKPEDAVRSKLEGMRDGLFARFGEKGAKRIIFGVPALILVIILLSLVLLLIPIKSINVTGDVTMFNEGEIIRASGISEGDSLLLRSSGRIERTLKRNLPLAESVSVKKSLSGRVTINVEFADVDYYFKYGKLYYAIDDKLNVLDSDGSRSKYSACGGVFVKLPEIREPKVGEKIVFFDTVEETDTEGETLYEVRKERFYDFASEFLKELKKSGFHTETDGVILEERFDVRFLYADKFEVRIGSVADIEVKFRALFEILGEGSMKYADRVMIDLSTPSKSIARADSSLDFDKYRDQ